MEACRVPGIPNWATRRPPSGSQEKEATPFGPHRAHLPPPLPQEPELLSFRPSERAGSPAPPLGRRPHFTAVRGLRG